MNKISDMRFEPLHYNAPFWYPTRVIRNVKVLDNFTTNSYLYLLNDNQRTPMRRVWGEFCGARRDERKLESWKETNYQMGSNHFNGKEDAFSKHESAENFTHCDTTITK